MTTVIAEFTSMLLNYYFGKDIIGNIYDKRFFSNLLTVIIGCSTIIIVCGLVNNIITNVILRLVSSVVLSSIIYILVLYLLNNTIAKNIIARVRIRIG